MSNNQNKMLRLAVALLAGGMMFQVAGCSLGDSLAFLRDFNPCGTILNCDPVDYAFRTSGYQGPGVDPDIDPFCTYPPFCNPTVDPIAGRTTP
jgi:hypothetical protein